MTDEQIAKITRLHQIPSFPYETFSDLKHAVNSQEVVVGAAMDFARQWITSGDETAPKSTRSLLTLLMFTLLALPVALVIYSIASSQIGLLVYLIPLSLSFMLLRPMMVRTAGFLKLVIFAGYALTALGALGVWGTWSLWLGLSIITPWLINKTMYKSATNATIRASLESEQQFVKLFKYNVVALNYPNGDMLWGNDCIERKM